MLTAYGDGSVFGENYGEGPVRVVWLHGWGRTSADFALSAQQLAAHGVASVALDLPGFGASPLPSVAGGARHYADLLVPVLASISDAPLVLVGHSFGGRVATVLAARHPDTVRALVLTGVPLLRSQGAKSPVGYRLVRVLAKRGLLSAARLEKARQKYGSADYRAAHGLLRDILVTTVNEDYSAELATLSVPTAFVWGSDDTAATCTMAQRALEIPQTRPSWRMLVGVGHMVPLVAPAALTAAVTEMVQ